MKPARATPEQMNNAITPMSVMIASFEIDFFPIRGKMELPFVARKERGLHDQTFELASSRYELTLIADAQGGHRRIQTAKVTRNAKKRAVVLRAMPVEKNLHTGTDRTKKGVG
ncbi:hypothetical protein [Sporobacter termitidis]|uniref:hypothetical protein n=1 Tax=Sporobacter termitidis TaxID=44749 RepID=UPI000932B250|nr:hypothetical protein [Sporobacter termitidis]